MRWTGWLTVALAVVASGAWADLPPPPSVCDGKKDGEACRTPQGTTGRCTTLLDARQRARRLCEATSAPSPMERLITDVAEGRVPVEKVLSRGYAGGGLVLFTRVESLSDRPSADEDTHLCEQALVDAQPKVLALLKRAVAQAKDVGGMACEDLPVPRCHVADATEGVGAMDVVFRLGQPGVLAGIVVRDEANVPAPAREASWRAALASLEKTRPGCHPHGVGVVVTGTSCAGHGKPYPVKPSAVSQAGKTLKVDTQWGCGCPTGPVFTLVTEPKSPTRAHLCFQPENDTCEMLCKGPLTFDVGAVLRDGQRVTLVE